MEFRTRKLIKPEDLNAGHTLFGGQLLKWIDEEAAIYAMCQLNNQRVTTKFMSEINFISPAKLGDVVEIVGLGDTREVTVTGLEMFQKTLEESVAGDNVGVLLRGIQKDEIERGMVLAKAGTITPHTKFESQVYVLTKEEGGRHTPFFPGYRPQFYVRTTDVTGKIESFRSDEGEEATMVMPGDRVKMIVELIQPIAIENGMRFAIREGGRTVGAGVVSAIIE